MFNGIVVVDWMP